MNYNILHQSEGLDVHWYPKQGVAHALYKGELTPAVSAIAYKISNDLLRKHSTERFRGVITDFTRVTKFQNSNTTVTRNQSRRINVEFDLSKFAIALLVKTYMQESIVWMVAKGNGTAERSKIVRSLEEGFKFVDEFRAKCDVVQTS